MQHKCPMCCCELPALNNSTVEPRPLEDFNIITSTSAATPAQPANSRSKIEALLKILRAAREKEPGTKTVLFSQWTSFLDLLEPFLFLLLLCSSHFTICACSQSGGWTEGSLDAG
jgi:SWI/SNF-related matrix-associated actin-dependent regulator of chromatin subfamily A3